MDIHSTVNNFVEWPHSGAVIHYSGRVGHKIVPCPLSCPSIKQLHMCSVFQMKVTVVKGSCLRAAEIENVEV
jgi:hypothetical protein